MNKFILANCLFGIGTKHPQIDTYLGLSVSFGNVTDWLRYSNSNYIIWTKHDCKTIYELVFQRVLTQDDNVLLAEADMKTRYGFLPNWIWQWIDSKIVGESQTASEVLRGHSDLATLLIQNQNKP